MSAKYVARLQAILDKLGKNGTSIPAGEPPKELKTNIEIDGWHNKHNAIAEYLVASYIKRVGEAREKKAKALVEKLLNLDEQKRVPGLNETHGFDNVALTVKISNPRTTLDRAKLQVALAKRGIKDADKIIEESESTTTPPRTLTASTTVE
jgi:hypothetical protein